MTDQPNAFEALFSGLPVGDYTVADIEARVEEEEKALIAQGRCPECMCRCDTCMVGVER